MMFSRARILSFQSARCQGANLVSLAASISSRAREHSYQRP